MTIHENSVSNKTSVQVHGKGSKRAPSGPAGVGPAAAPGAALSLRSSVCGLPQKAERIVLQLLTCSLKLLLVFFLRVARVSRNMMESEKRKQATSRY